MRAKACSYIVGMETNLPITPQNLTPKDAILTASVAFVLVLREILKQEKKSFKITGNISLNQNGLRNSLTSTILRELPCRKRLNNSRDKNMANRLPNDFDVANQF